MLKNINKPGYLGITLITGRFNISYTGMEWGNLSATSSYNVLPSDRERYYFKDNGSEWPYTSIIKFIFIIFGTYIS